MNFERIALLSVENGWPCYFNVIMLAKIRFEFKRVLKLDKLEFGGKS